MQYYNVIMLPVSTAELDRIRKECSRMSLKRAFLSAAVSVIPVPLTDIATDVAILKEAIPGISRKFGLSKEQIDEYDPRLAIFVYEISRKLGGKIVGRYITGEFAMELLKKLGIRLTAKQAAKYVPLAGQVVSAVISFAAMSLIIRRHINECYNVAKAVMEAGKHSCDCET